jgi:hypothetical protein
MVTILVSTINIILSILIIKNSVKVLLIFIINLFCDFGDTTAHTIPILSIAFQRTLYISFFHTSEYVSVHLAT